MYWPRWQAVTTKHAVIATRSCRLSSLTWLWQWGQRIAVCGDALAPVRKCRSHITVFNSVPRGSLIPCPPKHAPEARLPQPHLQPVEEEPEAVGHALGAEVDPAGIHAAQEGHLPAHLAQVRGLADPPCLGTRTGLQNLRGHACRTGLLDGAGVRIFRAHA